LLLIGFLRPLVTGFPARFFSIRHPP
jgi:hypothetical protein